MKHQTLFRSFLLTLLGLQSIQAATSIRPGVWEYTSTIKTKSGQMEKAMAQMQQQLASLPPEQRKMMEKTMASQGIVQNSKGNTIRVCVTKENAQQGLIPPSDGQCEQKVLRRSNDTIWFKFSCKGESSSTGEGKYTIIGNNAYKGKMTVQTTAQGHSEVIQMNQMGKWISNDCKTIRSGTSINH
jgi:hypothetical protein